MASASPVLQLGLLRMLPLLYWLKPLVLSHTWHHGCLHIKVNQAYVAALAPWKDSYWIKQGVPLGMVYRSKIVSTDASNMDWGALCDSKQAFGLWSK